MEIPAFVKNNAPAICTASAITAMTTATIFAARGHLRAQEVLNEIEVSEEAEPLTKVEMFKLTWKHYIPAAVSYAVAVASVIGINRSYTHQITAIVSAAALSEGVLMEYINKVEEHLDSDKIQDIKDEIAQSHVDEDGPLNKEILFLDDDETFFRDGYSGRYFKSSKTNVLNALNYLNRDINENGHASLTDFYDLVGLEATTESDYLGWSSQDDLVGVSFGSAIMPNGVACVEYTFRSSPSTGYNLWNQ